MLDNKCYKTMKSEKAKDILNDGSCHVSDGILLDGHRVGCADLVYYSDAIEAIKAAEQEAEERMRAKAEEAFLSCCFCEGHQYVRKKCENCEAYKSFIQELNEE